MNQKTVEPETGGPTRMRSGGMGFKPSVPNVLTYVSYCLTVDVILLIHDYFFHLKHRNIHFYQ